MFSFVRKGYEHHRLKHLSHQSHDSRCSKKYTTRRQPIHKVVRNSQSVSQVKKSTVPVKNDALKRQRSISSRALPFCASFLFRLCGRVKTDQRERPVWPRGRGCWPLVVDTAVKMAITCKLTLWKCRLTGISGIIFTSRGFYSLKHPGKQQSMWKLWEFTSQYSFIHLNMLFDAFKYDKITWLNGMVVKDQICLFEPIKTPRSFSESLHRFIFGKEQPIHLNLKTVFYSSFRSWHSF